MFARKAAPAHQSHDSLVEFVKDYLIHNKGADNDGRCYPYKAGSIKIDILLDALLEAQKNPCNLVSAKWRPWHFQGVDKKFENTTIREEFVCAKVESIIGSAHRNLDVILDKSALLESISSLNSEQLTKKFIVTVDQRKLEFSFSLVFAKYYQSSAYNIAQSYLIAIGEDKLAEQFKPYHMKSLPKGIAKDKAILDEVLGKKVKYLLDTKYNGDLIELVKNITQSELSEPFIDRICDIPITVDVRTFVRECGNYFEALKIGLRWLGYNEFAEQIRPYHMQKAPQKTYSGDSNYATEILIKLFDKILKDNFNDNILLMLTNFEFDKDIPSKLEDVIADPTTKTNRDISISTLSMIVYFKGNRMLMAQSYLKAKGQSELAEKLKPYHFKIAIKDYLSDSKILDELLRKKMDYLLSRPPYLGNLDKFKNEVTYDEISEPFIDEINGISIEVSTAVLLTKFSSSPSKIVKRYQEILAANNTDSSY
jgi:hypothetical protein